MRYGIISDIHGNLEALERVLEELRDVDEVICLGDIVGYGANPNECCELIREVCSVVLMGNHDAAAVGMMDLRWFNPFARDAIKWTMQQLSHENVKFLKSLGSVARVNNLFIAVHGSLREPLEEYILGEDIALASIKRMPSGVRVIFCGHTHIAEAYKWFPRMKVMERISFSSGGSIRISDEAYYIINCGSVGQPRDYNFRASFGIYDVEAREIKVRRLEYDINKAAQKIEEAGLPHTLAQRLFLGM
ncbi:MAG: metallophosphoesterase family protein [Armatimonadota bacterium]|nr:metallophosphatase family protein [Armatimonadota bacterium]MCX7778238.1 metallophosphatase family protein [Armatimonadota bacterium]MDW8024951.1 metallophosphoesterase family protein [Armatimonadota bacterium]